MSQHTIWWNEARFKDIFEFRFSSYSHPHLPCNTFIMVFNRTAKRIKYQIKWIMTNNSKNNNDHDDDETNINEKKRESNQMNWIENENTYENINRDIERMIHNPNTIGWKGKRMWVGGRKRDAYMQKIYTYI